MAPDWTTCHVCASPGLTRIGDAGDFVAISSDIRLVAGRLEFAVCDACSTLQKPVDAGWRAAVTQVYSGYNINHQGGGGDPFIFNSIYGPGPRAGILTTHLTKHATIKSCGHLLDIGCANGNVLRSFGEARPDLALYGLERSPQWREDVLALPGVQGFFSDLGELGSLQFDLIVMSHVLEHIPDPSSYLRALHPHLADGALLYLAVPDIRQNPVDLFVLDHCSHFDVASLHGALSRGGFEPLELRPDVLGKEIVAITRRAGTSAVPACEIEYAIPPVSVARHYLALCAALREQARSLRQQHSEFGIMGTATAAVWLFGELGRDIDFFVDEDRQRTGKTTLGKPVLAPEEVPTGACVFIPMSIATAQNIIVRACRPDVHFSYCADNQIEDVGRRQGQPGI